jgi:hypothetical protein
MNFWHGKPAFALIHEELFELFPNFVERNGIRAQFSRPDKLNIVLIRCNYGLQQSRRIGEPHSPTLLKDRDTHFTYRIP